METPTALAAPDAVDRTTRVTPRGLACGLLAAGLLGVWVTPAAVLAQAAPVVSSADRLGRGDEARIDGARELKRLAACVYKRRPGYFDAVLATPPGSRAEGTILERAASVVSNCMNSLNPAILMQHQQMRGAFAEMRYLATHPSPPAFASMPHPMIAIAAAWTERRMDDEEKTAILKHDFANCVVAADPVTADALLRTVPFSGDEEAVVSRLVPLLGGCLQANVKYKLDAPTLRALVAQALDASVRKWSAAGR